MNSTASTEGKTEVSDQKKKKKRRLLLLLLLLVSGCGITWFFMEGGGMIIFGMPKEGSIDYDVSYPDIDEKNDMMAAGLPDQAVYRFKGNKTVTHLSGMMGLIAMDYIADETTKTAIQTLVLFQNKYVAYLDEPLVKKVNSGYVKEVKLVPGEKKKIAGFNCLKAVALLESGKEVDVWYTKEIGTPGTNWSNPYYKIDGVLIEFEIEKYGITMKLTAKSFSKDKVKDEDFTVPSDYKKMPIEEIENIIKTLNPVK